jgi:hypothetical protein
MSDEPEQDERAVELLDICPCCGMPTEHGFGLAGGGYGVYVYCCNEDCDGYFAKIQVRD